MTYNFYADAKKGSRTGCRWSHRVSANRSIRHPYRLPAPSSTIKAPVKITWSDSLLDPIVCLSSFHKEPEFSLARFARSEMLFPSIFLLPGVPLDTRSSIIELEESTRKAVGASSLLNFNGRNYFRLGLVARPISSFTKRTAGQKIAEERLKDHQDHRKSFDRAILFNETVCLKQFFILSNEFATFQFAFEFERSCLYRCMYVCACLVIYIKRK